MKRFLALLMAVMILASLCACGVFGESAVLPEEAVFVSLEESDFYLSGWGYVNLDDVEAGPIKDSDGRMIDGYYGVMVDDALYYYRPNESEFHKANLESNRDKIWLSRDKLTEKFGEEFGTERSIGLTNFQYSDGYIYFSIGYEEIWMEDYPGYAENAVYRIGRISLENKSVECLDAGICAEDFVVDGDWLYYSETGYRYEDEYDFEKAGLYRVKISDGKEEKLLDYESDKDEGYFDSDSYVFTDLTLYKGKLYFIDNTDYTESRLCRMDTDGKNLEEVSSGPVYEYAIDVSQNNLYYMQSPAPLNNIIETQEIVRVSLKNFEETTIGDYENSNGHKVTLECKDGVIYFGEDYTYNVFDHTGSGTKDDPDLVGLYYDTNEEEAYGIYHYNTYIEKTVKLPIGETTERVIDKTYYYKDVYNNDWDFIFDN